MNLKFNFKLGKKNPIIVESVTTDRDWKIIIGSFVILMFFASVGFWILFKSMASDEASYLPEGKHLSFNRDMLSETVKYFLEKEKRFEDSKKNPPEITDPSL
ncbi:MAG: hypothetical protein A3H57_02035 [Candidatus Taylorbacteria bacterium RIFCSPLOWO2_02_FULL_43_11]|nr:MAG: hypothetical protein A2743_04225 [Candidatus Taylorbacteria bacterium RIFCSPHIGHO2_01_FULL_43_47]OHA37033.1 MAG: hypothetical protein A3H57_02035 [Candidatus Taylorbacteria bacterium RIFCSPLOWO2_02_FULL_43_11]